MTVASIVRLGLVSLVATAGTVRAAGSATREASTSALVMFHNAHPVTATFAHILGIFIVVSLCAIVLSGLVKGPGERW